MSQTNTNRKGGNKSAVAAAQETAAPIEAAAPNTNPTVADGAVELSTASNTEAKPAEETASDAQAAAKVIPETTAEQLAPNPALLAEDIKVPEAFVIDKAAPDGVFTKFDEDSSYVSFIQSQSQNIQGLVSRLEDYLVAVKPGKPIELPELKRQQKIMFRIIMAFVENKEDSFDSAWNALLYLFDKHRDGALGGSSPFRALEQLGLTEDEFSAIQRILNLLQLTANVESRELTLRQVSLEKSLAYPVSAEARRKIISFYQS